MEVEEIKKAIRYLDMHYVESDHSVLPNAKILKLWIEKGRKKKLDNPKYQKEIDKLADFKGLLNKKALKKAAKDYDEEQALLIKKKEKKKEKAKDKLEKLGLSIDDLKELLR